MLHIMLILQHLITITITDLIGVGTQILMATTATFPFLVVTTFTTSRLVAEEEGDLHLQYVVILFSPVWLFIKVVIILFYLCF